MKFDLHRALEWEANVHDFSYLVGTDEAIKATVYKSNQAIKLDLNIGAEVTHEEDGSVVTIDVMAGEITVQTEKGSYALSSNAKDSTIFSLRTPYTITAKQNSKLMVMVRSASDYVVNKNEELYRRLA